MREKKIVKVPASYGRDTGKTFLITEWPAMRSDEWGMRMIFAYNRGGGQIDPAAIQGGMEAICWIGFNTFLRGQINPDEVIPLLNQLLECVQIVRDPNAKAADGSGVVVHPLMIETDIEEIKTISWLRSEVIRVHTNFSFIDVLSNWILGMIKGKATS